MAEEDRGLNWHYEASQELDLSLVQRLRRFPREPEMMVYAVRSATATALRAWLRTYHRLAIEGRENLPAEGSFVLVSNHSSHLDALCLLAALPLGKLHRAFPAAASDYFFVSIPRTILTAVVVNALPFHRSEHIRQSIGLCRELLSNPGNILIIFPEGTRTTTGELGRFKPGIGALLSGTAVPILPCHIAGAFEAWPKGKILPRPRKLRLRIGKPMTFPAASSGKGPAQEIADALREAVIGLGRGT